MVTKNQIKFVKSLHQKKYRQSLGLFIVEGFKPIQELMASSFKVKEIYALREHGIHFSSAIEATRADMERMSALKSAPGVLAVAEIPEYNHEEESSGTSIAIDGISDPGNLGTLIRTADWFGFKSIVCSEDTVDTFNPKTVQAAMGSLFRVQVLRCDLLEFLQNQDRPVLGLDMAGDNLYTHEPSNGIYILGKESTGLSEPVRELLSGTLNIPGQGEAESLNVSIAGALLMSELFRSKA